ncbi:MAG: hypothetical protein ACREEB_17635 [Caulobacteraceae bacterium]
MHAGQGAPAWIEAFGALLTGIATVLAGVAALRGLNAWRRETVGRRKAELAEEVLAQFYRARDILTWARFPVDQGPAALAAPGTTAAGTTGKTAEAVSEERRMYAPVERLAQESQIFSELQASRYRFMAYFGEESSRPFDEVRALQSEVVAAAGKLIRAEGKQETQDTRQNRGQWESTIGWGAAAEDHIAHRLERAVREIEAVCRPLIDERARTARPFPPIGGRGERASHRRGGDADARKS